MYSYKIKHTDSSLSLKSEEWSKAESVYIDKNNWSQFYDGFRTEAKLLHTPDGICVKFISDEHPVTVNTREHNGDVYKDSCVELFISPDVTSPYYFNMEINAEGYILIGYGAGRDRIRIRDIDYSVFKIETDIKDDGFEVFATLPYSFMEKYFDKIDKRTMKGNLQKCGLNPEHYLSAFPIDSENPDFHVSKSFGEFILE